MELEKTNPGKKLFENILLPLFCLGLVSCSALFTLFKLFS